MNAPRSPGRGGERTVHIVFWTLILLAALLPLLGFLGTEETSFALVFPGWAAAVLAVLLPLIPVLAGSILLARRRGWGGALLAGGLFLLLLLSLSGVYDAIGELAAKESLVIPARLLPSSRSACSRRSTLSTAACCSPAGICGAPLRR